MPKFRWHRAPEDKNTWRCWYKYPSHFIYITTSRITWLPLERVWLAVVEFSRLTKKFKRRHQAKYYVEKEERLDQAKYQEQYVNHQTNE